MREYRNSLEKHNAPYRGVSKKSDFVNFRMAVTHDLLEMYNRSGGNPSIPGHKQFNQNNLSSIINGDKNLTTNAYTAGVLKKITNELTRASNLTKWTIPNLTYGIVNHIGGREWELIPPATEKGFFELEYLLEAKKGEKLLIRFKPKEWNPQTVFSFGIISYGQNENEKMKDLKATEFETVTEVRNKYFEHIIRFDEDEEVRLSIRTKNSEDGNLGNDTLIFKEFGIYQIEETIVQNISLDKELKPALNAVELKLDNLERRLI